MHRSLAALLVAVLAGPAFADPATGLFQWQVSADGGATWYRSITVSPGDAYKIRGLVSWSTIPGTIDVGFAGCSFEQIDLIGADDADVFGGVSGTGTAEVVFRLNPMFVHPVLTLLPGSGASADGLKLDNTTSPGRVDLGQTAKLGSDQIPNPHFYAENPLRVLELDAIAGSPKRLHITAPWYITGTPPQPQFRIYTTETWTNKRPLQPAELTDAHVWIRPNGSCVADFNGDGVVDFADVLVFLDYYESLDFRADLDRDGIVDFSDYLAFLNAYEAGC